MDDENSTREPAWLLELGKQNFGTMNGQVGKVVREFFEFETARLKPNEVQEVVERRMHRNFGFIEEVRSALNPSFGFASSAADKAKAESDLSKKFGAEEPSSVLWPFPEASRAHMSDAGAHHDWNHDQESLTYCAITYLDSYWGASPTLERIFVAALAFSEANGFSRNVRTRRYGIGSGFRPKTVDGAAIKRALWSISKDLAWLAVTVFCGLIVAEAHGESLGFYAFISLLAITGIYRHLTNQAALRAEAKEFNLLNAMFALSTAANSRQAPPALLRASLENTTAAGAVWPGALWQLVLRAEDRCRWKI